MKFSSFYQDVRKQISDRLTTQLLKTGVIPDKLQKQYDTYAETVMGGKMYRGALVCLGYALTNKEINRDIIDLAIAVEVSHASLLIHDDIIDNGMTRRGKPSLHVALGGNNKAISQALCFGDLGFFTTMKLFSEVTFEVSKKQEIISYFSSIIQQTIYGQLLDIELSNDAKKQESDIQKIHLLKTALYSFTAPLMIGAIAGGISAKQRKTIEEFGIVIGTAYQVQDDMLGIFGEEAMIGKSVTSDITEGKNTLLISYALQKAQKEERAMLQKYYGNREATTKDCQTVQEIMKRTGAITYSKKLITEKMHKAESLVSILTKDESLRQLFSEFITHLIHRKY